MKLDDSADGHLDALLKTVMAYEQEQGKKSDANVVTWRGMMTKVCLPFERASDLVRPEAKCFLV